MAIANRVIGFDGRVYVFVCVQSKQAIDECLSAGVRERKSTNQ